MVHGIPAHHQITDVQVGTERAGNAGVDDVGYLKQVAEDLGAHGGIDLAHAALDDDHIQVLQHAFIKDGACLMQLLFVFHQGQQGFDLFLHGTDNAELCHSIPPCYIVGEGLDPP